ncbi:MAG TPA: TIGR02281 family clan AA aspartic protease [Planctomycetaceae bacterium]|nr:TIGR02281 family clan AA aspartic protease [Planctomycetaceae bacterium]
MPARSNLILAVFAFHLAAIPPSLIVAAQETAATAPPVAKTAGYSDEVVAKADKIFADAGLKRSGKTVVSLGAADINREIGNLAKSRRTVKQLADARKTTEVQLKFASDQFRLIDAQNGELNLRVVQAAADVIANSRLIGLINANNAKLREFDEQRTALRQKLAADRKALIDAEMTYVDAVVSIRSKLTDLQMQLETSLQSADLQVAMKVYHANFQTAETIDLAELIGLIDRRIKQVEKEVFLETITLETNPSGALYVNVTVGQTTVPMVLDSGASMVILPSETATKLGVAIPPSAQAIRLVLADGRTIAASGVVIPKMRVGLFEVENVDAAVLEPDAVGSEPLLGMTFLGNFKFEVDGPGKTLKLLRVGE